MLHFNDHKIKKCIIYMISVMNIYARKQNAISYLNREKKVITIKIIYLTLAYFKVLY